MTSVSVALATYNGSRFIKQQLESIAGQTRLPSELVVTDDDSTDDTLDIVRDFARTARFPVKIYKNQRRLGYRANFISNILRCQSDIIALCDQDDLWDPAKLERCISPFHNPEVLLCFHESWLIDSQNKRYGLAQIYRLPQCNPPLSLSPMRNAFGFTMLFHRRLIALFDLWEKSVDNLDPESRMAHDQWIFFLASVFGTILFIEEPLASYRQHETNTYGMEKVDAKAGTLARLTRALMRQSKEYKSFSIATQVRADILEDFASKLDGDWKSRAQAASASYKKLARMYKFRSPIYNASGVFARLNAWRRMILSGSYTKEGRWALGRRAAFLDLATLFVPRRLLNVAQRRDSKH